MIANYRGTVSRSFEIAFIGFLIVLISPPSLFGQQPTHLDHVANVIQMSLTSSHEGHDGTDWFTDGTGYNGVFFSVRLTNPSNNHLELEPLYAYGNRIEHCVGLSLLFRFRDGSVFEWEMELPFWGPVLDTDPGRRPLFVPSGGNTSGVFCSGFFWPDELKAILKRHKFQCAIVALAAPIGLQSNTVLVNKCPSPPKDFIPLRHSRFTPLAQHKEARAEEMLRKQGWERLRCKWRCRGETAFVE